MNITSSPHIIIVGTDWPMETFLAGLIKGLIKHGALITFTVSHSVPLSSRIPGSHNLIVPKWKGPMLARLYRTAAGTLQSLVFNRDRISKFIKYSLTRPGIVNKLKCLHNLLPFARGKWDIIYFPWISSALELYPLFCINIPVVLSCRGSQVLVAPHNPARKSLKTGLEKIFRHSSKVHCVSEHILKEAEHYGLQKHNAMVIYTPVDSEYFKPSEQKLEPDNTNLRLVSVGNLSWVKGFEYALLCIKILKEMGIPVTYNIIGSGADRQRLVYTINDLGLKNNVTLLGQQTQSNILSTLCKSDLYLMSSLSEGISNAAVEAMLCEVPVAGFDCGGMNEIITTGQNGVLVPVRDTESLAMAISNLWKHPTHRHILGKNARKTAMEFFDYPQQISIFFSLFKSCLQA